MNLLIQLKRRTPVFLVALACFVLLPTAQALLPPPPPDGGYPGGNTAEGDGALFNLTTGNFNTAIGFQALTSNTTGSENTAVGYRALNFNTTGRWNTAIGLFALFSNTSGDINTASGHFALVSNTTGNGNTATGLAALNVNTSGNNNTATGLAALQNNTTANNNTATGVSALNGNTTGNFNTANGSFALQTNTTAVGNTATGYNSLLNNRTGLNNTANGRQALQNNTTGSFNIGLGNLAGRNLTTGSNNIDIGNQGVAAEARTIRIGEQGNQNRTFIAGIFNSAAPGGVQVVVNSSGRLGTVASSARFKERIKAMDKASEAILALKPVTYRYKKEVDPTGTSQFGLVAEEVEKVNPNLVVRDAEGKVYSVRYDAVNAMLLNEFLKEHRKVEDQGAMIAKQQKQIEALTTGLQKVSAQLEASKPALRVVNNNQ